MFCTYTSLAVMGVLACEGMEREWMSVAKIGQGNWICLAQMGETSHHGLGGTMQSPRRRVGLAARRCGQPWAPTPLNVLNPSPGLSPSRPAAEWVVRLFQIWPRCTIDALILWCQDASCTIPCDPTVMYRVMWFNHYLIPLTGNLGVFAAHHCNSGPTF